MTTQPQDPVTQQPIPTQAPPPYGPVYAGPAFSGYPPAAPRPVRPHRALVVSVAVLTVVVVGMGVTLAVLLGQRTASGPAATAAPLTRVGRPQDVLAELVRRGGEPCERYEPIVNPVGAKTAGFCHVDDAEMTVAAFDGPEAAADYYVLKCSIMRNTGPVHMAIGRSWTLDGDDRAYVERAALLLGARFLTT